MKMKKLITALLLAILSISLFPKDILALDTKETWESRYTNDVNKAWKISFNSALKSSIDSSNIKDYIYIEDYNSNKVSANITISQDRKSIEVRYPYYAYEKNKYYYIVILPGLESSLGKKLNKEIRIPFLVNDFINFKDKNLESEIRKVINKPVGGILREDVVNVQNLYLNNKNIESLDGLSYFANLKGLYMSGNKIKDISPLKTLYSLEIINLENNEIVDISDLKGLYNLKELYLRGNKIQNIESLSYRYNLKKLDLGNNRVTEVNSLNSLTGLNYLKLDNNYLNNTYYLSNLINLKTLYLDKNDITNYSYVSSYYDKLTDKDFNLDFPVTFTDANLNLIIRNKINKSSGDLYYKDLIGIKELDLSNASIYSLNGIKNIPSLEKLNLSGIYATDFNELQYLKNLKELNLNKTTSYSKSFLSNLTNMEKLYLNKANVYSSDLDYLEKLVRLTELDLSENYIASNLDELRPLNELLMLNLSRNSSLTSIEELKNYMKTLVHLNISYTNITNSTILISTINTFPRLEDLDTTGLNLDKEVSLNQKINFLDKNFEQAIREILKKYSGDIYGRDIRNIEKLELNNLNIVDLSGIEYFSALKYLDLSNNGISNLSPLVTLTNLETLMLHKNNIVSIIGNNSLSSLTKLVALDLSNNNISNISSLSALTSLKKLDLSNNVIERINELSTLTNLEYLSLYNNKVGYNEVVTGQPLPDADLSYLRYMFNLKELFLGGNILVTDYSYIVPYYEKLQRKDFSIDLNSAVVKFFKDNNEINTNDELKNAITAILGYPGDILYKDAKSITNLDLSTSSITRLDGIEYFVNLTSLKAKDISPVAPQQYTDLKPLGNLNKLRTLDLYNSKIRDITPLGNLKDVNTLWLSYNDINDITSLKKLENLISLKLEGNYGITDITSIKDFKYLTTLYLPTGKVNDFYMPTGKYYYNLANKNFTLTTSNIVAIGRIDDIFENLIMGTKFTLPSTLTANMTNGTTRQLEVIWDNYVLDTTIPGVYVYYGTVEGYMRKVKLTINIMEDKPITRGNSIGNIINKGLAAEQGEWIYYINTSDGNKIYKINKDGTSKTKLTATEALYLNVYGDWIYYLSNGTMYRIRTNGTSLTKVTTDNAKYINLIGDYIYYFNSSLGGVYKIKIADIEFGEAIPELISNSITSWDLLTEIVVDNGWIYYPNNNDGLSLYRIRLDGTNNTKINAAESRNLNVEGDYIYFKEGRQLYKMNIYGGVKTQITYENVDYINLSNGWIYYRNNSDSGSLYKIKIDGTSKTKLSTDSVRNINVVGEWIYYQAENNNFKLYRIKTDATNREEV